MDSRLFVGVMVLVNSISIIQGLKVNNVVDGLIFAVFVDMGNIRLIVRRDKLVSIVRVS
jgi:hypothetical protein